MEGPPPYPYDATMSGKFKNFQIHDDAVFKKVDGLELKAALLVPKSAQGGAKSPLIVHWHGGGFMFGHRLYEPWFAQWILELASAQGAVIVSPDYRLLPEATMDEQLDDLVDFWAWVRGGGLIEAVTTATNGAIQVDTDNILVQGESAGATLSVFSALHCPNSGIRAVNATYGLYDLDLYRAPDPRVMFGFPPGPPGSADEVIDNHLSQKLPVRIVHDPMESWPLCTAYVHAGRFLEAFGQHPRVDILKLVEKAETLPAIWLAHGTKDSVAPVENTKSLVKKIKESHPEAQLHVTLMPDVEHGFDVLTPLEESWVQEGVAFLNKVWPQ